MSIYIDENRGTRTPAHNFGNKRCGCASGPKPTYIDAFSLFVDTDSSFSRLFLPSLRWRFPRGSSEVVSPLLQRTRHVDENRDLATFCQPHRDLKNVFIGFNRDDKGRWVCMAFDKINLVSATRLSLIFTYGYPPPPPPPSSPNPLPHHHHHQSKNDHSSCGRTAWRGTTTGGRIGRCRGRVGFNERHAGYE